MPDVTEVEMLYREFNKQRDSIGFGPIKFETFMEAYRKGLVNPLSIIRNSNSNSRKERRETWDFDGFNRPDEEDSAGALLRDLRQDGQTANAVWVDGRIVMRNGQTVEEDAVFRKNSDRITLDVMTERYKEAHKQLIENNRLLEAENKRLGAENERLLALVENLQAMLESVDTLTNNPARRPMQRGIE